MEPLRVAVALPDPARPEPGARRLLDRLAADPRFALVALLKRPAPAAPKGALAVQAAAEARALGARPRPKAPAWEAAKAAIPVLDQGHGSAEVVVDLAHTAEEAAPFGTWRLDAFGPGAGWAEAAAGAPATEVALRVRRGGVAGTLATARYGTKFLAARNAAFIREKSVQLAERELARLARDRALPPLGRAPAQVAPPALPAYWARAARGLGAALGTRAGKRLGRRPGMFTLATGLGDALDFAPERARRHMPPKGHYWADPFLFETDGRLWLFFEDVDYARGLGHISVAELREEGTLGPVETALRAEHHLSYPFVFAHEGAIYMLPETHQAGRLEIWRATDFPTGWTLHATALEGVGAVDTVLLPDSGGWWLFTNVCRDSFGDHCSELHLYRCDGPDLTGLVPHPLNPVVIDATTARGGGRVMRQAGMLLRPSQDNSHGIYGWGLNVMEITRLDMEDYAERRLRHVTPDFAPDLIGCHHFDAAAGRFVVDLRLRSG